MLLTSNHPDPNESHDLDEGNFFIISAFVLLEAS